MREISELSFARAAALSGGHFERERLRDRRASSSLPAARAAQPAL